jgi:PPM family protein phosphatase
MSSLSDTTLSNVLIIQANSCLKLDNFGLEIKQYLGLFMDVHYFQVNIHKLNSSNNNALNQVDSENLGLLRVGNVEGSLEQELQLRSSLKNHKMIHPLLTSVTEDNVILQNYFSGNQDEFSLTNVLTEEQSENALVLEYSQKEIEVNVTEDNNCFNPDLDTINNLENNSEYLEEEYLEEEYLEETFLQEEKPTSKLLLLSYFPNEEESLAHWLKQEHSLEESLSLSIQICQFFRSVFQKEFSVIYINPKFIKLGTPIQFFDLTGIAKNEEKLTYGITGDYCSPELALSYPITEEMSTYIIGLILYQSIHHKLPNVNEPLEIKPIPNLYQIINSCLCQSENRFTLSQLLNFLIETRKLINNYKVNWTVASYSTVGLSRLQNEDSYGIKQQQSNRDLDNLILAVVADGMGGMAQGEVASKIAVNTILEAPIPQEFKTLEQRSIWLTSVIQKANNSIAETIKDGGTTLSLILAVERELMIAHIGDSRIFLIRNGQICQLSEDHSMVGILLASGQITYEEMTQHPDRNMLIRSLGSKRNLSDGYIQDLSKFKSGLSMNLENEDILLLCSDGVWDLITNNELAEIFINGQSLQDSVNKTINQVLARGATDNATLLALKINLENKF